MAKDLTGMKFGRLTVISRADDLISNSGYKTVMWNCKCECGNDVVVRGKSLTGGVTRSCGCFARDNMSKIKKKHGGFGTRLYNIWDSMRQRCLNKKHRSFHNYGGRGVKICREWDDFNSFREWAYESGYRDDAKRGECTLDRIDVNGDYTPSNCRWVNMKTQSNNKRDTIFVKFNNEVHSLRDWSSITGVKYETLWARYNRGKTPEEILSKQHLH